MFVEHGRTLSLVCMNSIVTWMCVELHILVTKFDVPMILIFTSFTGLCTKDMHALHVVDRHI